MELWTMTAPRKWGIVVLCVVLLTAGLYCAAWWIHLGIGGGEIRKADVILSSAAPAGMTVRELCPIPLPATASNVCYAVWSFGEVTQSWTRFEAPVADCLAHAESLVQPFRNRDGYTVTSTPISEDTGVLCVLDPSEVDLSWFDDCQSATGVVFRVSGGRAPVIWVETNRGGFYCEVKNECHSLSPQ